MKSIIIRPDRSLIFICLAISSAASILVSNAVLSTFLPLIELPEFISIETSASVGFITKYPPDFSFISESNIWFNYCSIFSSINNGTFPLYFFTFLTLDGMIIFIKVCAFL